MGEEETVHIEGDIPQWMYDELADKFAASDSGGKRNVFRALVDDWRRLRKQEIARATGELPENLSDDRE